MFTPAEDQMMQSEGMPARAWADPPRPAPDRSLNPVLRGTYQGFATLCTLFECILYRVA